MSEAEAVRLRADLEHARAALAADNEGIRLWMLDCAAVSERHRMRWQALRDWLTEQSAIHGRMARFERIKEPAEAVAEAYGLALAKMAELEARQ